MVEVVVAFALLDVTPQLLRQLVLRVLVDEVEDMVADQGWEPADFVAGGGDVVADVRRRGGHHLDRVGVAAGLFRGRADEAQAPSDNVGIGQLQDDPVGDAAGGASAIGP